MSNTEEQFHALKQAEENWEEGGAKIEETLLVGGGDLNMLLE
jgi:hypothetical protein